MDNGQPSHWNKALHQRWVQVGAPLLLTSMLRWLLRNPVLAYSVPACCNTTAWTRPETPGVASAVHTGRASGRGPRATFNATRRIRPRSRQFSCHDQSDSRRHLRDSTCDCLVSAIYGRTTLSPRESRDWGSPWSFSSTARRRRPGSIGSRSVPKRCTRTGSCLVSSTGPVFTCSTPNPAPSLRLGRARNQA